MPQELLHDFLVSEAGDYVTSETGDTVFSDYYIYITLLWLDIALPLKNTLNIVLPLTNSMNITALLRNE
jgi:hypothetical protein